MKISYILIGIVCIIIIVVLLVLKKYNNKPGINTEKINDIKSLKFSYSVGNYMDGNIIYELECNDECVLFFKDDGVSYEDGKKYNIDKYLLKEIIDRLNEYEVYKWDGFNGSDPNVLDGHSFSLSITYNDNKKIYADGYESWPDNYSNVKSYINEVFSKYTNKE